MQVSINGIPLTVIPADNSPDRIQGLMNVHELGKDSGMLFRWPTPDIRSFWMKDTSLPLDIAYISEKGDILSIETLEPFSLKSVVSPKPASCALEVNRGWFDNNGVEVGDIVFGVFNGIPRLSESRLIFEQSKFRLSDNDFYYEDVIDPVINDILNSLPDLMPAESMEDDISFDYSWPYPIDPEVWAENWEDEGAFFELELEINAVDFSEDHPGWNINGHAGWGGAGASISIEVQLRPGVEANAALLVELESELSNVVAHELHHLTQHDGPFQRPSCPIPPPNTSASTRDYFLSSCEVPAFLIGFRAEASRTGLPVEDLVNRYLGSQVAVKAITKAEASTISQAWLGHSIWSKD